MNISDIAALAGVSVATVSRTINNRGKVSPEVAKRVMQVIEENHYTPNVSGRNLRTSKTSMLLVAIPTISNSFYSGIIQGIEQQASHHEYNIIVAPTQGSRKIEDKYIHMLTSKQVDGYISFFTRLTPQHINELSAKFPFVQACECLSGANTSAVQIDNRQAAYDAVCDFIARGHRRIGLLSGSFYKASADLRNAGYRDALAAHGIPCDPALQVECGYDYMSGHEACQALNERADPPTALFCVCDDMAAGAVRYYAGIGKQPGRDVEIIGFDDTAIAEMYLPSITSVAQPSRDIGVTAVDLLIEKIKDLSSTCKKVILPHKIIRRETTR